VHRHRLDLNAVTESEHMIQISLQLK